LRSAKEYPRKGGERLGYWVHAVVFRILGVAGRRYFVRGFEPEI
jgi:hypothetical protein